MGQFEIQDDHGVLFRGSLLEAMRIWEILMADKNKLLSESEKKRQLIPFAHWHGNLKIVSVIDEIEDTQDFHIL